MVVKTIKVVRDLIKPFSKMDFDFMSIFQYLTVMSCVYPYDAGYVFTIMPYISSSILLLII